MRTGRFVGRARIALLILNVALLVLISLRYSGVDKPTVAKTVAALSPASVNLELPAAVADLPPINQFGAIVDRPLFHASRRPLSVEMETTAPVGSLLGYALKGTIIRPDTRIAILEQSGQSSYVRASEGEVVAGWRLEKVEADRAVFELRGRSTILKITPFQPAAPNVDELDPSEF